MPDIVPTNTEVLVCRGVPLDNKYNDTILFTSAGAQQGYFRGKAKYSYNGNFTYQRVQNKVNNFSVMQTLPNPRIEFSCRVPVNADKIYDCNYLCFCNKYDTNKWWYCFIKEVNYINPNCTEIIYEIDAFQTFLFDFTVEKSFVVREHTSSDLPHEYICLEDEICVGNRVIVGQQNLTETYTSLSSVKHIFICAPYNYIQSIGTSSGGTVQFSGMSRKMDIVAYVTFTNVQDAVRFIQELDNQGYTDSIMAIFVFPSNAQTSSSNVFTSINLNTSPYGTVHNKMLLNYPFRKIRVRGSNNEQLELSPELFGSGCYFRVRGALAGSEFIVNVQPINYAHIGGSLGADDENVGKLNEINLQTSALCAWYSNSYQIWLAQNQSTLAIDKLSGASQAVAGLATGIGGAAMGYASMASEGFSQAVRGEMDMMKAFAAEADAQHLPAKAHGSNGSPSFDFEYNTLNVIVYDDILDEQSFKRLDAYFTRYGYKVNKIKVPTPFDGNKRPKFNFVQTADVNITGNVPTPQMNIIKSAFDRGITFWHNTNVGEYAEGEMMFNYYFNPLFDKKNKTAKGVNNSTYLDYYYRLKEIAINMFEWRNLPETVDPRFLELTLCDYGFAVYFNDEIMGNLALTCMIGGKLDIYRIPTQRRAYANNGYKAFLTNKNSVLIFNNYMHRPTIPTIQLFASRLSEIERTIDVNVKAQKTPVLITGEENELLTMKNVYKKYDGNEPVIYGTKGLSQKGINVLKTDAPFVSLDLNRLKRQIWNEAMTFFGVENSNTDKRERLISDEVLTNLGVVQAQRYIMLNARRDAAEKINKMFGTNIEVYFRKDTLIKDTENVVTENSTFAVDETVPKAGEENG